jgi:hypothetical protein
MEEIKHLKIETVTYLFPKFTRVQKNVFDSCMPFYFFMHRRGVGVHPTAWLGEWVQCARRAGPGRRGGRPRLLLVRGNSGLLTKLINQKDREDLVIILYHILNI